jgi:hypothetical protein
MSLLHFAQEYSELGPGEQNQFSNAIRRLLSDGLIWREDENDRPIFSFVLRRRELVADYLAVAGWELRYDQRLALFHVVHREGAHRRRLNRDTTIWLLLLRLIYAEQREQLSVSLTRNPVVEQSEIIQRYTAFFPGQAVRKRSSLNEALRSFQSLKLIRAAGGGTIRANSGDQQIELLPSLEVIVPASSINELAKRLQSYDRKRAEGEDSEESESSDEV